MIIANSSLCCNYIDDILDVALRNSDKAIEWDFNFIPPSLSDTRNSLIREFVKCNGIRLSFHLPYSFYEIADESKLIRDNSINVLKRHIQYISDITTSTADAVIHIGTTKSSRIDIACDSLKELSEFAICRNVSLCVENLTSGLTINPYNLDRLLSVDGVEFCFDIGHAEVVSRKNSDFLKQLANRITYCRHAHIYRTEENYTHIPFENIEQLANSSLVSSIINSNCKWITFELEDYQQQLQQDQLWRKYYNMAYRINSSF